MRTSLSAQVTCFTLAAILLAFTAVPLRAQSPDVTPVTDAMLQDPAPGDWLMWRRTLDGWGYSPLDQIDRDNVGRLRMVWSRGLGPRLQQGTPLVYDGVMYMPNPRDVIQALDAVTGDVRWEYRRDRPDDLEDYILGALTDLNRSLAIYGTHIIDPGGADYVFALDAVTGELACIGTSVTSPAPKFLIGGAKLKHLYHNSTLALDADTGEIVWNLQ